MNRRLFQKKNYDNYKESIILDVPDIKYNPDSGFSEWIYIIILTKGKIELLVQCMESIFEHTKYLNYCIWIADTGSSHKNKQFLSGKIAYYNKRFCFKGRNSLDDLVSKRVTLIEFDYFNYSKINNEVVNIISSQAHSNGDFLLFCNNDVKLLNDCITGLLTEYRRIENQPKKVGTLGIRLHYQDNTIQHLGIKISKANNRFSIDHISRGKSYDYETSVARCVGNTGAFMFTKLDLFLSLGMFNESYIDTCQDVDLYTNNQGIRILIDSLQLPYDKIYTIHRSFSMPHPALWALPKIYTYSLQNDPFLHIDGDVFIFESFPENLFHKPLIAQNEEVASEYYISVQKQLLKYFTYFPEVLKKDFNTASPIHAANAGILGGTNIDFFKDYTKLAMKYVNKNKSKLSLIDVTKFNIFFEQHLFYCCAKQKGLSIAFLIKDIVKDHEYINLGNFWEVPFNKVYLHLLGEYKQNKTTCLQLAYMLRYYYPEYYYKIISLFKNTNLPLKHDYYYQLNSTSEKDLRKYFAMSRDKYLHNERFNDPDLRMRMRGDPFHSVLDSKENIYLYKLMEDTNISRIGSPKTKLRNEHERFCKQLTMANQENSLISSSYLYGRDIESINWYRKIFKDEKYMYTIKMVKSPGVKIISSDYNWGEFWNGFSQVGSPYYNNLKFKKGEYLSMIIPESYKNGFSLYEIEQLDVILLDLLTLPKSIYQILLNSENYFEKMIIENNLNDVHNLIIRLLKLLVLRKAIQPVMIK